MRVGDYMRYTKAQYATATSPLWVRIEAQESFGAWRVKYMCGSNYPPYYLNWAGTGTWVTNGCEQSCTFTVVPADKLPDEYFVLMAQAALLA